MEWKINIRLFLIGILSMILTGALTLSIFHKSFDSQVKGDIRLTAKTLGAGYGKMNEYSDLQVYCGNGIRITLVAPDGSVLFESDTDAKEMENHGNREEIVQALATGQGEAMRQSDTLGYNTYYYAMLMADGNVLRTAVEVENMYSDYNDSMPAVVAVGLIIMIISIIFSRVLTKTLVGPIEAMANNIDDIDKDVPYKELEPFALAVKEHQVKKAENTKMREEFTANVSHELKTPLTSISGYAEMIENGMVTNENIGVFAGKIHSEAVRLMEIIGDILKLSELDEPNVKQSFEKVDLLKIATSTVDMLSFKAEKSKVSISVGGNGGFLVGNKMMLEELVYNLCDNAIRYNKDGGRVRVEINTRDKKVILTVTDNGIGISKENQERIFERFYRVDKSRSKETGGTGLGLAIVKHIAIQHNGKIYIESQKDKGTRMKVVFETTGDFN
ncbi:MAG TPA: two-component sensor histidine kinase [Lachnospiraceae bacterium]|nr:two-component sensor histidine kinase [Lachnospiraceae bacterium]